MPGAQRYQLCPYRESLISHFSQGRSLIIMEAVVCCAVGRADIVGRFFDDLSIDEEAEKSAAMFLRIREAITIVFPFLGMPKCIPACYGLIGVVRRKGEEFASIQVLREPKIDDETVQRGMDLRRSIYKDVGNGEIFGFMDRYFKDLCELCARLLERC